MSAELLDGHLVGSPGIFGHPIERLAMQFFELLNGGVWRISDGLIIHRLDRDNIVVILIIRPIGLIFFFSQETDRLV